MKKVIATWSNGVSAEVGQSNCEAGVIVAIAECKEWCKKKGFNYPEFQVEED